MPDSSPSAAAGRPKYRLGLSRAAENQRIRTSPRRGEVKKWPDQSPDPGAGEKYFSNLPSMPSKSLASGGESFFWVMFGQSFAYSVFTSSHFSSPGSVSGLIASAGHSGSHTPQSMHSSGWMTSMLSPS